MYTMCVYVNCLDTGMLLEGSISLASNTCLSVKNGLGMLWFQDAEPVPAVMGTFDRSCPGNVWPEVSVSNGNNNNNNNNNNNLTNNNNENNDSNNSTNGNDNGNRP